MTETRIIDGKRWALSGYRPTKIEAQKLANSLRKQGRLVRVIKGTRKVTPKQYGQSTRPYVYQVYRHSK